MSNSLMLCSLIAALTMGTAESHSQSVAGSTFTADVGQATAIARGRYMVLTGHCNNCHTAAYAATAGGVPEDKWLLVNPVGWRAKQGTVYATNLRLYLQAMDMNTWLVVARDARPRAPMPWWSLRETSDDDLKAMYLYIRSLQPAGAPAPPFLPPSELPKAPYNQLPDLSGTR